MTFVGQIDAGSTCALASFEGSVRGLPGVTRFWGKGSLTVPELLYDAAGNVVGSDCDTAGGFSEGTFAATVELF
jgi:hypothetical protein